MAMQEKTFCFTGHRDIPPTEKEAITRQLEDVIIQLVHCDSVGYLKKAGIL